MAPTKQNWKRDTKEIMRRGINSTFHGKAEACAPPTLTIVGKQRVRKKSKPSSNLPRRTHCRVMTKGHENSLKRRDWKGEGPKGREKKLGALEKVGVLRAG